MLFRSAGAMPYRHFGATGLKVSEVGFGAWAIGGKAYGTVERQDSLRALARALDEVARRHEVLRTRCATASGSPVAVVDDGFRLDLPVADLAAPARPGKSAAARLKHPA